MSLPHDGNGELLTVNIYDATATTGTPVQLTGSASPFSTSGSDDSDFYTPVRSQSGYIRFICKDENVISDIMPEKATDRPVTLTDASGAVRWAGFLSGEQYTQPWEPTPYSLQLPVKGLLSTMAGVEFTQADGFTSMVSLMSTIAQYLPYTPRIIYPKSMAIDKVLVSNDNFREFLSKEERKDQNTENVYSADSIETVFEEFCKYFGVSAHEYHGDIYLIAHDATEYLCSGGSTVAPVTHDLLGLGIVGASNKKSFAKFYRYVRGEFDTGSEDDKAKTVMELNDFSEYLPMNNQSNEFIFYDAAEPLTCLIPNTGDYYTGRIGNDDYAFPKMLCGIIYRNGSASYYDPSSVIGIIFHGSYPYYNESGAHQSTGQRSSGGTDMLQISTPSTNEIKKVFTIKSLQDVKITKSESSLINIQMSLRALGERYSKKPAGSSDEDDTKYAQEGKIDNGGVYLSIKVGDLYLKEGESNKYSWSSTESYIMCPVSNGTPVFNYLRSDKDVKTSVFVEDPGILISLPDSLRNKLVPIEVGLWSGICHPAKWSTKGSGLDLVGDHTFPGVLTDDKGNDFDATFIHLIVTNFKISIAYEGGTQTIGTDLDQNVYIVPNDNASTYKYDVSSTITTRRGIQHGTGLALNDDLSYCATTYDLDGCKRRAAMVAKNREMLTVAVENNTAIAPFDTIAWHGKTYSPLADNIDWHDNENELKLINID